jgi:hypothetical protein
LRQPLFLSLCHRVSACVVVLRLHLRGVVDGQWLCCSVLYIVLQAN